MTSDNPWTEIQIPKGATALKMRRVIDGAWDFFWARSVDRKYLLVLSHDAQSVPSRRPPRLRGLEVKIVKQNNSGKRLLMFRLLDSAHRDIFHQFCNDIIASTDSAKTEKETVDMVLVRTWRWHYLLRTGKKGLLSLEQQKGLIGELLVLEYHLIPNLPVLDAVLSWRGPLNVNAPKDFEIGRLCIEAKTRRGTAAPHVVISSEHQLDSEGIDALFLHVVELDSIPSDIGNGFSLTDVTQRVQSRIAEFGNETVDALEIRLAASGFRWEDDYSNSLWIEGKRHLYQVTDRFPRIVSWGLKSGVTNVKYSVALTDCEPFRRTDKDLAQALEEMRNG